MTRSAETEPAQAPPRSPEQDELDALIEEARRRARRRRFGYLALAVAASLVAGGAYLAIGGSGGTVISAGRLSTEPTATCRPPALALSSENISPATGEQGVAFFVTNRSGSTCSLKGYPRVELIASGKPMPFDYQDGGGPYITTRKPEEVTLLPRGRAEFLVAKYRCDVGEIQPPASVMRVTLPGSSTVLRRHHSRVVQEAGLNYCKAFRGPPASDPGNTVVVSPVTSRPSSLLPR
jgi:hypothetical protein